MKILKRSIGKQVAFLYRKGQIYLSQELEALNISLAEYSYILAIPEEGTVNLQYLSEELGVDKGLTTKVINSLVKKEFITKERSLTDKRAFDVALTNQGRIVRPKVYQIVDEWNSLLTNEMSDAQIENLSQGLGQLISNVKEQKDVR